MTATPGTPVAAKGPPLSVPVVCSDARFKAEVLDSPIPVLVDFWAPWCGPCRQLAPVLDELAAQFAGRIKFVTINTDENPEVAKAYHVTSIPTLNLFSQGTLTSSVVGPRPKPQLAAYLTTALQP